MAIADAGQKTRPIRNTLRWVFVAMTPVVWVAFLLLLFADSDSSGASSWVFTGTAYASKALSGESNIRLHGVFNFVLDAPQLSQTLGVSETTARHLPSVILLALMVLLILVYTLPGRAGTAPQPNQRGIHPVGKAVLCLLFGVGAVAFIAGLIDATYYGFHSMLHGMGLLEGQYLGVAYMTPTNRVPDSGIALPETWALSTGGVLVLGLLFLPCFYAMPSKLDRYTQTKRWPLLFTLLGFSLVMLGMYAMEGRIWLYAQLFSFMGGGYTAWMVGWFVLTWAVSSRSLLFLMHKNYEQDVDQSGEHACLNCGYDLRGTVSDRCPECGHEIGKGQLAQLHTDRTADDHAESLSTTR